ncbi:leucyl aminopeptidase [Oceaniserpentilla sp. 4NH20-0058]|uniref:leucyl aminopeptidase n=1 Tax=Oceaniserpentilla sp. 4NH20-0058 TaxID=3127660 RepID=UPI003103AC72
MQLTVTQTPINEYQGDALILFVPSEGELPAATATINNELDDFINQLQQNDDIKGKVAQTLVIPQAKGPRLILIGLGQQPVKGKDFIKALNAAASALKTSAANTAAIDIRDIELDGFDTEWAYKQIGQAFQGALYHFDECKSKKDENPNTIESLTVIADNTAELDLKFGQALAKGMAYTKKLGDMPPNVATPSYLADEADKLATMSDNLATKILDEDKMEELGMGSFLSVSKGSIEPGKIICMEYLAGKAGDAPHVLVGKGITFDTGGISLKPGAGMDEMKYDMCGAASVLGTMLAIIELELPINFVGVIAAAENMPSGHASKPGDIVTAMNGTTIEILNTDAEGRLVLCDALTYAIETYEPASIVDIATLTGACMAALGRVNSGLFTEVDDLAQELIEASNTSRDTVWRLPLQEEYQELLDSNFADIANIGGPLAGATTAACFLSRFTEGQKWAHLDIAGTAWHSGGKAKGASGRPVPLLVNYLANKI